MKHLVTKITESSVRYWQKAGYWTEDLALARRFDTEAEAMDVLRAAKGDGIQYLPEQIHEPNPNKSEEIPAVPAEAED